MQVQSLTFPSVRAFHFLPLCSIINSTSASRPFEAPGKCGIPVLHSQPCKANRLARLHRAGFALQCPFSNSAFSSAWEDTHCQPENEIPGSVNVSQGLWCWKYYLWKKHCPVTELKAPRFWEEYQCSVTQKEEKGLFIFFPTAGLIVFQNQAWLSSC